MPQSFATAYHLDHSNARDADTLEVMRIIPPWSRVQDGLLLRFVMAKDFVLLQQLRRHSSISQRVSCTFSAALWTHLYIVRELPGLLRCARRSCSRGRSLGSGHNGQPSEAIGRRPASQLPPASPLLDAGTWQLRPVHASSSKRITCSVRASPIRSAASGVRPFRRSDCCASSFITFPFVAFKRIAMLPLTTNAGCSRLQCHGVAPLNQCNSLPGPPDTLGSKLQV